MYNTLADYYDTLVKDDKATQLWKEFFINHKSKGDTVLELASGSGEITIALAQDYKVDASDLSEKMLEKLKSKDLSENIKNIYHIDMRDFSLDKTYDNIICFCDSINYVLKEEDLMSTFKNVKAHLKKDGVFMFDMHSHDRLDEFLEEYIEVGKIEDTDYQWTIKSDEDLIFHHFAFYQEDGLLQEQHIQRVYDAELVIDYLKRLDFKVEVYTDFSKKGINKGEKIFIVGSLK